MLLTHLRGYFSADVIVPVGPSPTGDATGVLQGSEECAVESETDLNLVRGEVVTVVASAELLS
jgi:hypothetical protein